MRVSIYLPTKNRRRQLEAAVQSVLTQSWTAFELIVVNDASTDDTFEYLERLQLADERVRIVHSPESLGGAAARNVAIRLARGEYVTGLDDDDEFEPYRLAAFLETADSLARFGLEASCLYAQERWTIGGKTVSLTKKAGSVEWRDLAGANSIGNQVFAKRSVLVDCGLFDPSMPAWQDLEFFLRVTKKYGRARLVDVPSYVFDVSPRPDRISSKQAAVLAACRLLSNRHFRNDKRAQQELMLQVFNDYYGFRPSLGDCIDFLSKGVWPRGALALGKRLF